jgi:competence protein ComEC
VQAREAGGPSWWGGLLDLRTTLEGRLRSALPEPAASLVAGVVLGGRAGFSPDLRDALAATGTGHIVAVSGFNVVVLAAAMRMALVPIVGQRWALLPMALVVWLYAVLVGAPPSAIRAAIMVSFVFLAQAVGRLPDPITVLALTAATMVAWDPSTLTNLGFQLSVAATAGLVLFTARIADRLPHLPVPAIPGRLVREPLAVALAAQLATLPIILGTFHTLSTVAPVANVLIGPLVPATMLLGGVLVVVAPLPGLGTLVAWPTWAVASGVLGIVETLADLPGSVIFTGRWPVLATIAWYAILLGWVVVRSADVQALCEPWQVRRARWGMVGVSLLILPATLFLPDGSGGRATATLLDAGGLAVLARSSDGRTALIVGDGSSLALAASLGQHLRFAERGLDLAVATGDGRTGEMLSEALRRYPAAAIVGPRMDDDSPPEGDGTWLDVRSGQRFAVGSDVEVEIVDVREHSGRPAADVLLRVGVAAVWLPAPGPSSVRWQEVVAEERPAVLRRPTRSPGWAREAPVQPWLAIVTDMPDGARPGAVTLDHRTHGAVVVVVDDDEAPSVRPERCPSGGSCSIAP